MIYLAAPLFTAAEQAFNAGIAARLRAAGHEVAVPQDFCLAHAGPPPDFAGIHRACLDHLARATLVVAVLDGADPDSGTCFEAGWACARGIPVIGLRTDMRPGEDGGLPNCMLTRSCAQVVRSVDALLPAIARLAAR
ncbi:MAG: nucleoside 2-deoxyribosyltransferase [Planctomycetes bacterium]|nr:nucleoside 2-deoxyribosyltransferase [Planctomycetota bacterium]